MVVDFWRAHPPGTYGNIVEYFVHNLKELKPFPKPGIIEKGNWNINC